jgi:WD40 repeat protein
MFQSAVEAIQYAPPLSFSMDQKECGRCEVESVKPTQFVLKLGEDWVRDRFCSVAQENSVGRVYASDNVVAVCLLREGSEWVSLPATEGTVLSLSLSRNGDYVVVAAGTRFGLDVFILDALETPKIVNRTCFESKSLPFVQALWDGVIVGVDEDNQILLWKLSGSNVESLKRTLGNLKRFTDKWLSWTRKDKFKHASDDRDRRHLLILSSVGITVWSPDDGIKGVLQVSGETVSVLPSHAEEPFLAVLVFASGQRKRVHSTPLTHGAISMSLGEEILPPECLASPFRATLAASSSRSTIMCADDGTIVLENARFPFSSKFEGPCNIVSVLRLSEPAIGISVVRIDSNLWHCAFLVHGRRGGLATILIRTVPHVLGTVLSSSENPNDLIALLIQNVGTNFTSDWLFAAHDLAMDPTCSLNLRRISAATTRILAPTTAMNRILFSPLVSSVRRKYSELSHRVVHQLQQSVFNLGPLIEEIEGVERNTRSIFSEGGWLDVTSVSHDIVGLWSDLGLDLSGTEIATASQGAAAQALFLDELSQMINFVKSLCIIVEIGRKSSIPVRVPSQVSQLLWCKRERRVLLLDEGTNLILTTSKPLELSAIDVTGIPDELKILATIRKECMSREFSATLSRTLQLNTKMLQSAGLMKDVCSMLTSLGLPAVLQGISFWIPHDTSENASRMLFETLEEIEDAQVFSSVAHFALSAPPQLTVEWVTSRSFSDSRRDVLVQLYGAALSRLPHGSVISLRGQFWHALTLLNGSLRDRRDCRLMLMEFAQSKCTLPLSERATAIKIAHSIDIPFPQVFSTADLMQLCELQQVLLAGCMMTEETALGNQLETQLLSEEGLYRAAVHYAATARCAPEVQLALILRHDDIAGYSEAICSALESEMLWCIRDGSPLVDSLRIIANKNLPRFSQEVFPMARFLALMFVQHGTLQRHEMHAFCSAMKNVSLLDPMSLFMAVGDVLITTNGEWDSTDVLTALVQFLGSCKFSSDERMRCLEIVSSHVALICSEVCDDESEFAGRYNHIIDALKQLVLHHPSTHLLASQIMSALRNSALF